MIAESSVTFVMQAPLVGGGWFDHNAVDTDGSPVPTENRGSKIEGLDGYPVFLDSGRPRVPGIPSRKLGLASPLTFLESIPGPPGPPGLQKYKISVETFNFTSAFTHRGHFALM